MDPRASSSTPHLSWACYKQLGVQEIKDVEISLKWLIETYPFVDAKRIGISGPLSAHGVKAEQLPRLIEIATADICHQTNPRPCKAEDFQKLFEAAL